MFDSDILTHSDNKRRRYINDAILLAACLLIAGMIWLIQYLTRSTGGFVEISTADPAGSDETVTQSFSLNESCYIVIFKNDTGNIRIRCIPDRIGGIINDSTTVEELSDSLFLFDAIESNTDRMIGDIGSYTGSDERFINILHISGHKADMVYADCPDLICVKARQISRTGESIVCLPHGIVVTVTDSYTSGTDVDAVTW